MVPRSRVSTGRMRAIRIVVAFFWLPMWALCPVAYSMDIDATLGRDREAVRDLQRRLNELGFNAGSPDGAWRSKSDRAISDFRAVWAADLPEFVDRAMVERVRSVHDSWFAPPDWINQSIFLPPVKGLVVYVTAMVNDCKAPECTVAMMYMAAGDLTGDGLDDLVTSTTIFVDGRPTRRSSAQLILGNDPTGTSFSLDPTQALARIPLRIHGREPVIADFNGDGKNDLFIAAHGMDTSPFPGEPCLLLLSTPKGGMVDASDEKSSQAQCNEPWSRGPRLR